ncbi:MAG: hypothetical protein IT380_17705 [Myxococcales bacterium]|nr:hypothetical protein [Myxococcales bacterium]
MSEHLSALVLDEAAAGLAVPAEASAHLSSCEACRARLGELQASRAAVAGSPAAARTLDKLLAKAEAPTAKRGLRLVHVAAVALPLAAALALLVFNPIRPGGDDTRLKGAATVELLDAQGRAVTKAKPGETLTLAVGGAGYSHAVVVAIDAQGVTTLWPKTGGELGRIEPGARVRLDTLTVTPGDVRVVALFASKPLLLGKVTTPLVSQVVKRAQARQSPLDVDLPPGLAEASASVRLEVVP